MRKTFLKATPKARRIVPKEVIDELIFNFQSPRERLIFELQAKCGAPIGEVLNIRVEDIEGRKIIVKNPNCGKDNEVIFMPEQIVNRLKTYKCKT